MRKLVRIAQNSHSSMGAAIFSTRPLISGCLRGVRKNDCHGMLGFDIFVGANRYPVINYLHYFITTIFTSMGEPGTGFVMVGNFNY